MCSSDLPICSSRLSTRNGVNSRTTPIQIISILLTIVVAVIGTFICIGVVRLFTPLRVDKRDEQMGLDMSEHNETAYPSFNGLE